MSGYCFHRSLTSPFLEMSYQGNKRKLAEVQRGQKVAKNAELQTLHHYVLLEGENIKNYDKSLMSRTNSFDNFN